MTLAGPVAFPLFASFNGPTSSLPWLLVVIPAVAGMAALAIMTLVAVRVAPGVIASLAQDLPDRSKALATPIGMLIVAFMVLVVWFVASLGAFWIVILVIGGHDLWH